MDRGLDSFRQLMAQAGTQLAGVIALPKAKASMVQMTLAAVVAVGGMAYSNHAKADDPFAHQNANQEHIQPDWTSDKSKLGAGIGAVSGALLSKAMETNPAVTSAIGAGIGWLIGSVEGGKDKVAQATAAMQKQAKQANGGFPKLSSERDLQMAKLQAEAASARVGYLDSLRQAKEAEIDKTLMPNSKAAQQKYQQSLVTATKALRKDRQATENFSGAFESLLGRYDVSAYSHAYAKLSQPANINDASYRDLSRQAVDTLTFKNGLKNNKNDRISNTLF